MARVDPKYTVPKAHPYEIPRSRLLERLKAGIDKRLLILVAPAGYGKSTLLAQYAHQAKPRVIAWVNLSNEESEALVLGRSVAQAVGAATEVALTRWERAASLDASSDLLATSLAADLNLNLPDRDLTIVLEAVEHLSEESGRWLRVFLQRLGEGHQVALTLWDWAAGDATQLSRFVADGQTLVLTQDDLAFTPEETEALFRKAGSKLDAHEVYNAVGGWPAALGMVLYGAPFKGTPQDLVGSILRTLPEPLRAGLPEAAVLKVWSEDEAARLGLRLPRGWLYDVQRSGLPIQRLGGGRYGPHRVLQSVLEDLLGASPERHAQLHAAAAERAQADGDLITAVEHYRLADCTREAQGLLDELLPRYQRRSEWTLIRKILEPFKQSALSPYAATMLGTALIETRAPELGNPLLYALEEGGKASGATYFALALTPFRQGAYEETLSLVEKGLAVATVQRDITELLRVKAAALAFGNRKDEALDVAEACVSRAERQGEPGLLIHALAVKQFVLELLHRYDESVTVGRRGIDLAFQRDMPKKALPAVNTYASTLYLLGRAGEMQTLIERVLQQSEYDYPLARPFMISQRASMYDQLGQRHLALAGYQEAATLFLEFENRTESGRAFLSSASLLLEAEQGDEADALFMKARELAHPDDLQLQLSLTVTEGMFHLHGGDVGGARAAFEAAYEAAKKLDNYLQMVIVKGYLVEAKRREGDLNQDLIRGFIEDLDTFGYDWILRRHAVCWRGFYLECAERGWFEARLRPYLEPDTRTPLTVTKPKLEVKLFGRFSARLDGRALKLTARPQEVLAYLVLHGPTRIEVLANAVWPQASVSAARRNLAQQVRALRETLAQASGSSHHLVTEEGSYRLSAGLEVVSDAEALEQALSQGDERERLQAIRLYNELLPHLQSEWVLDARRHFEHMAASLALALARYERPHSLALATELYETSLRIDPFVPETYQELAHAYEAAGNQAAALQVRRRWRDVEAELRLS